MKKVFEKLYMGHFLNKDKRIWEQFFGFSKCLSPNPFLFLKHFRDKNDTCKYKINQATNNISRAKQRHLIKEQKPKATTTTQEKSVAQTVQNGAKSGDLDTENVRRRRDERFKEFDIKTELKFRLDKAGFVRKNYSWKRP